MIWKEIVKECLGEYISERKLAKLLGVSQPTIHRLKAGTVEEPKYSLGVDILKVHKKLKKWVNHE